MNKEQLEALLGWVEGAEHHYHDDTGDSWVITLPEEHYSNLKGILKGMIEIVKHAPCPECRMVGQHKLQCGQRTDGQIKIPMRETSGKKDLMERLFPKATIQKMTPEEVEEFKKLAEERGAPYIVDKLRERAFPNLPELYEGEDD